MKLRKAMQGTPGSPPVILIAEDDAALNHLICSHLNKCGYQARGVLTGKDTVAAAAKGDYSLLLLDYNLPDMTGEEVVRSLHSRACTLPFIVMTGHGDEKLAVEMMKMGARDYLVKERSFIDILPKVVEKTVRDIRYEQELRKAENTIREKQEDLSILYRVSSAISQTLDLDRLLHIIIDTITDIDIFKVEKKGVIFLMEKGKLKLSESRDLPDFLCESHRNIALGTCLCGLAAEKGQIIISSNCFSDKRHTVHYPGMEAHGHVVLPIKSRGVVIGVLCLYTQPDLSVTQSRLDLLDALGTQIGIAIDNARLYNETRRYSLHDALTGLANRRALDMGFARSFSRAKRQEEPFSVIMLDIDHFKEFNDTKGHSAGDVLLVSLSKLILKETRDIDLAVRYGGEEFLILLSNTDQRRAQEVAERIRGSVEEELPVTVSLGISSLKEGTRSEQDLIDNADSALYRAKGSGRNRVEVSP